MTTSQENVPPHLTHLKDALQLIPSLPQTSDHQQEQLKTALEQLMQRLSSHDDAHIHSLAAKIHLMFTALKQEQRNSDLIQKTGKDLMELAYRLAPEIEALPEQIKNLLKIALIPAVKTVHAEDTD